LTTNPSEKVIVVYKPSEECLEKTRKILSIARSRGFDATAFSVDDLIRYNGKAPMLVVSVGGDGTLLKISRVFQQYTPLVLPIPCGRRTAFYEEIREQDYEEVFDRIVKLEYRVEVLRRIRVSVLRVNAEYLALNEALLISRDRGRVTGFTVTVKSISVDTTLTFDADGVLIGASPGSAAYNLSARGPLIEPLADCLFITPLNPVELNIPTIVTQLFSKIRVSSRGYTELYIDGEKVADLKPYTEILVESSDKWFRIARVLDRGDRVKSILRKRGLQLER